MDLKKLIDLFEVNQAAQAICDLMGRRARNQYETKTDRMLHLLAEDGHEFTRSQVIAGFRGLEEAGCGRYVEGRHGWKSRFVWSVQSRLVWDAYEGAESLEELEADRGEAVSDEPIEHSFVLRPDLTVSLELPADLTRGEALRLSQFISALSFEEE